MTTIADHGTGYYYYLENPEAFAEVFEKEFYNTQTTAVSNLAIYIPVGDELALVDASGYPVHVQSGYALFYPGTLRSGQTRQLFLTLRVPTDREKTFTLDNIIVRFLHNSQHFETSIDESLTIACTTDRQKVRSSIDKLNWTDKVLKEDYNRLKQNVAADIRAGKKQTAIKRIENYYSEQEAVNEVVGSAKVTENLDKDINELRTFVEDTFHGAPEEVRQKQKSNAKALQYEGYSGRRN
jgi:Ca-activated chloride channel family protein